MAQATDDGEIMQRIVPNVWCQGTAAEAGGFQLMERPDAYHKMLGMKKLVVADF